MSIAAPSPANPMRALVAFTTMISAVCTAAEPPAAVERPTVVVGENWTYAGLENGKNFYFKVEVEQSSDSEIRTIVTPNGNAALAHREVFDRQWNLVEVIQDENHSVKFSPYLPVFDFPLRLDKTWTKNYEWQRIAPQEARGKPEPWRESQGREAGAQRRQGSTRVEARVLGWENITVPAGTYTAIKIELLNPHYAGSETRRIFGNKELVGGTIRLFWYAPKVKRFVKHKSRLYVNEKLMNSIDMDLIAYNEAPSASTKGQEQGPLQQYARANQELLAAIERGNGERTLELLKQGVDPNTKDALGRTALMYAGINGQTKVVMTALLEKGANVNSKSLDGTTALIASTIFSDPDAVRLLLSRGADVDARDNEGRSALEWALVRLRTAPNDRSFLNLRERIQYGDLTTATAKEVNEVIEVLKAAGAKE